MGSGRGTLALGTFLAVCGPGCVLRADPPPAAGADAGDPGEGDAAVPAARCDPLPAPDGDQVQVSPADVATLADRIADAPAGTTFLFEDGTYELPASLVVSAPGVTLRSVADDAAGVVVTSSTVAPLIQIQASDVAVADLSLVSPAGGAILVTGGPGGDITGVVLHRLQIADPKTKAVAIESVTAHADGGTVSCSQFELGAASQIDAQCTERGAIRAEGARDWAIRDNRFSGFFCTADLSETIHFTDGSRDTVVERNVFVDTTVAIRLGADPAPGGRMYADPLPTGCTGTEQHLGGIVRNNAIVATAAMPEFDSGVALWSACGATAIHNTVFSFIGAFSCIEWRFADTSVVIANNLVSDNLKPRDLAIADQAALASNVTGATADMFADAAGGDLHLAVDVPGAPLAGEDLAGLCLEDLDGDARDLATPDVGADERD